MPAPLTRRRCLQLAGGALVAGGWGTGVQAATLPLSVSLRDELAAALAQGQPLLVMVSLEGCPFCKVARQHYLAPLREQQGVPVVQVDMRNAQSLIDFQGRRLSHDAQTRVWNVRLAPTVLFFGRQGREVAERLVGGYLPDFYGAYLDERLTQARASLR